MTTAKLLNGLVEDIALHTGDATSSAQAKEQGKESFLYLEYASVYGGYRLVRVNAMTGGHAAPLKGMGSTDARAQG